MTAPHSLQARREKVEAEIEALKKARAEAMADDKPFAGQARLDALTAQMQALVDAQGVEADRDRAEMEAIRLRKKSDLQSELAGHWRDQLEDWSLLEIAMKNAADLVRRMRVRGRRMNKLIPAIAGRGVPGALAANQLDNELAMWLMAGLQSAVHPSYRLGPVVAFPMQTRGGLYPVERDWAEIQARRGQASIDPIIEGAQPMPKTELLQLTHQPETPVDEHSKSDKAA
jgi:hypothetical protein